MDISPPPYFMIRIYKVTFDVVNTTLLSIKYKKKEQKVHRDISTKALTMNDQSQSHKPRKEDNSQSKRKSIKDECSFCHKKYH